MTWRVRVLGPDPRVEVRAGEGGGQSRKGSRRAWFPETGLVEAAVHDRYRVGPGARIEGPAVVEERESTVVIGPSGKGRMDPSGALVVEMR